jgi:hypothetical protein
MQVPARYSNLWRIIRDAESMEDLQGVSGYMLAGGDISMDCPNHQTLLYAASCLEALKLILNSKLLFRIDSQDVWGNTALLHYTRRYSESIDPTVAEAMDLYRWAIIAILQYGANPFTRNEAGLTALQVIDAAIAELPSEEELASLPPDEQRIEREIRRRLENMRRELQRAEGKYRAIYPNAEREADEAYLRAHPDAAQDAQEEEDYDEEEEDFLPRQSLCDPMRPVCA